MWTLVTGGAKRLGAAVCFALADEGHSIVIHYNKSQKDAEDVQSKCLEKGVSAEIIQGDFSSTESIQSFIEEYLERFPDSMGLVNNVGNYFMKPLLQTGDAEWLDLFYTNLHAPFMLSKALMPSLIKSKGYIVNLGVSGLHYCKVNASAPAYLITKEALFGLTKSFALECAKEGVRVNMVSPGYTDIAVDLPNDLTKLPMKRAATSEEIARAVAFFVDPKNSYITGQNLEVSGGFRL